MRFKTNEKMQKKFLNLHISSSKLESSLEL